MTKEENRKREEDTIINYMYNEERVKITYDKSLLAVNITPRDWFLFIYTNLYLINVDHKITNFYDILIKYKKELTIIWSYLVLINHSDSYYT